MKKVILSIFLILICYFGYGQTTYPITQNLGSSSTLVKNPNYGGFQGGLIPYTFADTTAANTALTYGKNYNGFEIYTQTPQAKWWRLADSSKWIMILPQGGGTPLSGQAWLNPGNFNLFTDAKLNGGFGTLARNGIYFKTNALTRMYLDKDGIAAETGTTVGLGIDLSDSNRITYFTGAAGWGLTGNSGTTAGTNFIGTTDNVDLVFKRNSVESGRIGVTNTSFGVGTLSSSVGNYNSAFGTSLGSLTTGDGNSALGNAALSSTETGNYNTGIGYRSINANTLGSSNSAIGYNSGYNNNGDNNIFLGSYSGYYNDLSNRVYVNSLDRSGVADDTTKSIIYGYQDANPVNQRLSLNSQIFANYIKIGSTPSDEMVGRVSADGRITPVIVGSGLTLANDTLTSTGSGGTVTGSGTINFVPKWTPNGTVLGDSQVKDDGTTVSIAVASGSRTNLYAFGNSITMGYGLPSTRYRWSTLLSNYFGYTENNFGLSGSFLEKQTPVDPTGVANMVDRISLIPTYTTGSILIFAYGINDVNYTGVNYNPTNFVSDYRIILDSAVARGWTGANILLITPTYVSPTSYQSVLGQPAATEARHYSFDSCVQVLSGIYSTNYFDSYTYMENNGARSLFNESDSLHPNVQGHNVIFNGAVAALGFSVLNQSQKFLVNGRSDFNNLKLNTTKTTNIKYNILASDSTGYISKLLNQVAVLDSNGVLTLGDDVAGPYKYNFMGGTGYFNNSLIVNTETLSGATQPNKYLQMLHTGVNGYIDSYTSASAVAPLLINGLSGSKTVIGGTSSQSTLSVWGGTSNTNIGSGYGSGYNGIWLNGLNSNTTYNLLSSSSDQNLYLNRPTGKDIYFAENNVLLSTPNMIIKTGGKVGFGTDAPDSTVTAIGSFRTSGNGKIGGKLNIGNVLSQNYGGQLSVLGAYTNILTSGGGINAIANIFSNSTAAIDVGGTMVFGGETGNGVGTYAFAGLKGAKQTAAGDGDYKGYLAFYTISSAGAVAERMRIDGSGNVGIGATSLTTKLQVAGRFASTQGADVASTAGAMTLGTDGNSFEITGTNSITLLSNVGWVNGSEVTLMFTGAATLVNGTATSGTNIQMLLAGGVDFVASANDVITLILGEIGGTQVWREKSRSVN